MCILEKILSRLDRRSFGNIREDKTLKISLQWDPSFLREEMISYLTISAFFIKTSVDVTLQFTDEGSP